MNDYEKAIKIIKKTMKKYEIDNVDDFLHYQSPYYTRAKREAIYTIKQQTSLTMSDIRRLLSVVSQRL
jgi:hypothetical protein